MTKEIKHKITPEKAEKKLDQKIEKVLNQELNSDLDEKIKEIVDQKLEEKIGNEVEEHLTEQMTVEPTVEPTMETDVQDEPKKANPFVKELTEFKTNFHLCWRGSCRIVSLLTIPLYLLIAIALLFCHFTQKCNASNGNIALTILFIIVAIATISLILSLFSAYPKTALIFWIILDVPLLVIVFIFSAQYIGLIILSLLITLRIIQISRGGY